MPRRRSGHAPGMTAETAVRVDGRVVHVSSLDRVLFPAAGFTKAHLVDYVVRVADRLLPHVVDRPVTLHRFPEGVGAKSFFQTRTPPHPDWVRTVRLSYPRTGKTFEAPVLDNLSSLVWATNLSTIEIHPFLARTRALDRPLLLVVDLDPGPPAGLLDAAALALRVRDVLVGVGLVPFVKSTGGKGLHVVVPLDGSATYEQSKVFARDLAGALTADDPARVTYLMTKAHRPGKVFVDWSQNDPGKSTLAPYSLRAGDVPTVAAPLAWDEVADAVATRDPRPLVLGIDTTLRRLDSDGDLFGDLATYARPLPFSSAVQ